MPTSGDDKKIKRRSFLAAGGAAAFSPWGFLVESLLGGLFASKAMGAVSSEGPRNYVLVNMYKAPARWPMDLILKPKDTDPFQPHPVIVTNFTRMGSKCYDYDVEYRMHKVDGINFSYPWSLTVPSAKGGERPMVELTENMLNIRGCNMVLDGHENNNIRLDAPEPGNPSLSGMIADVSTAPIPSVSLAGVELFMNTAAGAFTSAKGKSAVVIGDAVEDYFQFLADPFLRDGNKLINDKSVDEFVDFSIRQILDGSYQGTDFSAQLKKNRAEAEKLLRFGFEKVAGEYAGLLRKYQDLVDRSLRKTNIPGVTDKPIPGLTLPQRFKKQTKDEGKPWTIIDYLGPYREQDAFIMNRDVRTLFDTAEIKELAKQFALTEIILKYNLSNSVIMTTDTLRELNCELAATEEVLELVEDGDHVIIDKKKDPKATFLKNLKDCFHDADSHETGSLVTLLNCTLMWRAISSCVLELQDQLKKQKTPNGRNKFDETLIHITTEFEREPDSTDWGTHHGFTGHTSSLISGIIRGPEVIGNIYDVSHDPNDVTPGCGTWGKGAPVKELGDREIRYGNITSSLAEILRVESPVKNEKSLLKVENERVKTLISAARNVKFAKTYFKKSKRR